jgi:hypothetical protein
LNDVKDRIHIMHAGPDSSKVNRTPGSGSLSFVQYD